MKKITVEIKTENAAFIEDGNDGHTEAARILRHIADRLEALFVCPPIDANGNKCGRILIED